MRIETVVLTVLLAATPAFAAAEDSGTIADHFSAGAGAEVDLVGLAYGVRPELLFRPVADAGAHIRLAVGFLAGPEITFLPVALGYRHVFRLGRKVQPHLGAGVEWQTFWYGGETPASRPSIYAETGFEFQVSRGAWVGLQYGPDFSPSNLFGFGFVGRLTFRYDL